MTADWSQSRELRNLRLVERHSGGNPSQYIVQLLDDFTHDGPNGVHPCLALILVWILDLRFLVHDLSILHFGEDESLVSQIRLRQSPFWVETFDPKPNAKNPKLKFRHIHTDFMQILCILGSDGFRWVLGMPRMGYKMAPGVLPKSIPNDWFCGETASRMEVSVERNADETKPWSGDKGR